MIKNAKYAVAWAALALLAGCASDNSTTEALGRTHSAAYGPDRIHYVTTGKGDKTLVFIHCWAGNLSFWREQVPALREKARLVLIDLPGHGQSDKPQTNYTMDYFAGAVLAVMKDAHVEKATLIGHSMGVPIICRVYTQAPEKVAALVAVDGTLRRPEMTAGQAAEFTARYRQPDYQATTSNFLKTMFPNPATEALRDEVISQILATPQYVMAGAMDGMFNLDLADWDLKQVSIPVLVINAHNPMWNDNYKAYVQSLSPKTDYRVIEGTGHWVMLEKPAEFNAALIEALAKFDLIAE
jgi:pimeloyl-ACP methyl ester carboxylesterase